MGLCPEGWGPLQHSWSRDIRLPLSKIAVDTVRMLMGEAGMEVERPPGAVVGRAGPGVERERCETSEKGRVGLVLAKLCCVLEPQASSRLR